MSDSKRISDDPTGEPGAREADEVRITTIKSDETLGYVGGPSEEHSGSETNGKKRGMEDSLADNLPGDVDERVR